MAETKRKIKMGTGTNFSREDFLKGDDRERENLVLLNTVGNLGSVRLRALLERFGSPGGILRAKQTHLEGVPGIGKAIASGIGEAARDGRLERELTLIEKHGVKVITVFDKEYPVLLTTIYDPPVVLYLKGTLSEQDTASVAVVGSRRASYYGFSTAEKLSWQLASSGWTVVSGLARGIDTSAHKGALKAKGRTIAVLGNGLASVYPSENKALAEEIAGGGVLCSEFPMETRPDRKNFPMRNRIISGLSLGVVVVEAAERSGALITADLALEQGREVFAVPGNVSSDNSRGTNYLIKQGAKLVEDIGDVVEELAPALERHLKGVTGDMFKKKVAGYRDAPGKKTDCPLTLNNEEEVLYRVLESDPLHVDELAGRARVPVSRALGLLVTLELKGLVRQLPGKVFAKR